MWDGEVTWGQPPPPLALDSGVGGTARGFAFHVLIYAVSGGQRRRPPTTYFGDKARVIHGLTPELGLRNAGRFYERLAFAQKLLRAIHGVNLRQKKMSVNCISALTPLPIGIMLGTRRN